MYIMGIDPEARSTTPEFGLGQYGATGKGEAFIYAQANGTISTNSPCVYENGQAQELDTGNDEIGARIGWCNATIFADNEYGWLMVIGRATAEANGAMSAGLGVIATGEDGNVTTHASTTPYIGGCHVPAAITDNSTGTVYLSWPTLEAR